MFVVSKTFMSDHQNVPVPTFAIFEATESLLSTQLNEICCNTISY